MRSSRITAGLVLLAVVAGLALSAPLLAPQPPESQDLSQDLQPPSADHPFGQDKLGRDVLSRVLYGARISLLVGGIVVLVSASVGGAIGALAGYASGRADDFAMRVTDIVQAFPGLLLAIALSAVLGPSIRNAVLALCLTGWAGYARLVRGEVLAWRARAFVEAAVALGAGPLRIMTRHILPQVMAPLLVQATFGIAGAIVAEASLSFLGLGVQPPTPSWGASINDGRAFLLVAPHIAIFPGLAIMITVLAFNLLSEGLRDALDVQRTSTSRGA